MALRALILGAAAGGGLPQWNCAAPNSAGFWGRGAPLAPATQSSLAVSADGEAWALMNASPDLRAQIMANPALHPRPHSLAGMRNSPIRAVVITNGDVDHVAGLLSLRERHAFDLWTTPAIADVLSENPVFSVLDPALVRRRALTLGERTEIAPGLSVTLYPVPGKVALYLEGETVATDLIGEQTVGALIEAGGRSLHYIPGCAAMNPDLAQRLRGAACVLFDGTVFHDDEMIREGVGTKTGRRMGHMAMAGPEGSLAAFAPLGVERRIYVHINNTNPVWRPDSPERAAARAAGWEIGYDGMEVRP